MSKPDQTELLPCPFCGGDARCRPDDYGSGASGWRDALKEAVAAIYFTDSSDYLPALWSVVRSLSPELAELLERDASAAYHKADALAVAPVPSPEPREPTPTSLSVDRIRAIANECGMFDDYYENAPGEHCDRFAAAILAAAAPPSLPETVTLSDEQIDAAIEALFPNDNHYHAEWLAEVARPIARAIESAVLAHIGKRPAMSEAQASAGGQQG